MRICVVGAGQVGRAVVEALHDEHEVSVLDIDPGPLQSLAYRYDVATAVGSGASRRTLQEAGIADADLLIACTGRDEINVVGAILARRLTDRLTTVVRASNTEYIDVWRERHLDVDHVVSSELETAHAVSRLIGLPAALQTDVFADGQVQIVELDVTPAAGHEDVIGPPLREARIPKDSKVASIIRGGEARLPRGDQSILPGDRIVVIGSPAAAREWSSIMARGGQRVEDVVVFGCGSTGTAVGRLLLEQDIGVRLIEPDRTRALRVAEELPEARVYQSTGLDPDFLQRERIGDAGAAVFALHDDAKNLYAAALAKLHGVRLTIAVVHDELSSLVLDHSADVDIPINPRSLTAEEIVRFAHDPRTQQVAMLEGDRYEVLDVTVRPQSALVGVPFKQLPMTGALIGSIVRDGRAIFPHGEDMLAPDDRVIVFTDAARAGEVEDAL
jgi:trk system potassium uptake protein TrkA